MAFFSNTGMRRRRQTPNGGWEGATATTRLVLLRIVIGVVAVSFLSQSQLSSTSSCLLVNAVNLRSATNTNSNSQENRSSNHHDILVLEQQQQQEQERLLMLIKGPEERVLETTMTGDNLHQYTGAMFDIDAKTNLIVETLSCHIESRPLPWGVTATVTVYTKQGSFQDHMLDPRRWIKVADDVPVTGQGHGRVTTVPSEAMQDIPLEAGTTQAFYVYLNVPRLEYTTGGMLDLLGLQMGDVFEQNEDMAIRTGASLGQMLAFDKGMEQHFTPAMYNQKVLENSMWNGQVHYRLALDLNDVHNDNLKNYSAGETASGRGVGSNSNAVQQTSAQLEESLLDSNFDQTGVFQHYTLATDYAGTDGGQGLMFDVQTSTDVPPGGLRVLTLDLHIAASPTASLGLEQEEHYLSVFTKPGSFVGQEGNPHAWRRVFSGTVVGEGLGKPTRLPPDMFESMIIPRGSSQAFYVVMEEPLLNYGDGIHVGKQLAQDDYLQIDEGSGIAQVFGGDTAIGPRSFNGAVQYDLLDSEGDAGSSGTNSIMVPEGPKHSLVTSMEGGNTAFGIMFDVICLTKSVQVQALQVHLARDGEQRQDDTHYEHDHDHNDNNEVDLASVTIEPQYHPPQVNKVTMTVYTLEGSHVGREKYPSEWTLLGEVQVTPQGLGQLSQIPLGSFTSLNLMAGTRHAFYITANRNVLQYSGLGGSDNGSDLILHNVAVQNEHLMLLVGTGLGRSFFGGLFQPRTFNGALIYQEMEETSTLGGARSYGNPTHSHNKLLVASDMVGANGSFGSMIDVVAKPHDAIMITGLNIHTKNRGAGVTVRVYTKQGSYAGFEQDRGDLHNTAWTLVLPPTKVTGAGMNLQTPLPDFSAQENESAIHVKAGATQAFLIILDTAELRYDVGRYSVGQLERHANNDNDNNIMPVDSQDEFIEVLQGTGLGRDGQIFFPRLFNGAVRYTVTPSP
jgi:hypothetical protein